MSEGGQHGARRRAQQAGPPRARCGASNLTLRHECEAQHVFESPVTPTALQRGEQNHVSRAGESARTVDLSGSGIEVGMSDMAYTTAPSDWKIAAFGAGFVYTSESDHR